MSDHQDDVMKSLGRIEAQLDSLLGNGQPGLVQEMRSDIDNLKTAKNFTYGFGAGLVFIEGAFHYVMHKLKIG